MKFTRHILLVNSVILMASGMAQGAEHKPSCCSAPNTQPAQTSFSDKSIFQTDSSWTTDDGRNIKLNVLAERPQVIVMLFTRCTSACPTLVNDLRQIEASLPAKDRAKIGFTLVSFDTERDTPAALVDYRKTWSLPASTWTLLSGKADDVRELAALLGVKYRKDGDGQFSHSNVITVLNSQGEIVRQQFGLDADVQETVRVLNKELDH
jgi:protein SCO1/2